MERALAGPVKQLFRYMHPRRQHHAKTSFHPGRLPIAACMNKDINTVLAMAGVREKFDTFGVGDGGGSPDKFAGLVHSEIAKWATVAKEANVRIDG